MNATTPPLLEVRNLCKRFPGVIALDSVAFQAHAHEVHALIGENGAGKSTLMKILAGVLPADAGEILVDGRPAALRTPLHSLRLGIHQLPQDIGVIANLSAAENIHVGAEPHWGPWLNRGRELQTSAAALEAAGARFDPRTPMWQLNAAQQQRVMIARAIAREGRVLVLDEPTSCLGERDAEQLLDLVCRLRGLGMAIIYISHRLNEIYALADRITVLHEGRVMGSLAGEAISTQAVIRLMSRGGGITEPPHRKAPTHAVAGAQQPAARPLLLQASGITDGHRIKPASFDIARGEVLGLTGLVGSGRSRLCRLLCAADALRGGSLRIDGHGVAFRSPAQALRAGVVYVPDTDNAGALFPRMSLHDNVTLGLVGQHRKLGLICDDAELARRCRDVIDRLQIRMADEGSGGGGVTLRRHAPQAGAGTRPGDAAAAAHPRRAAERPGPCRRGRRAGADPRTRRAGCGRVVGVGRCAGGAACVRPRLGDVRRRNHRCAGRRQRPRMVRREPAGPRHRDAQALPSGSGVLVRCSHNFTPTPLATYRFGSSSATVAACGGTGLCVSMPVASCGGAWWWPWPSPGPGSWLNSKR
jgi:ribose transport system ATP-binding protein